MFVVTLLTAPRNPDLDPALVEALRSDWGGVNTVWLSPDEAAEFTIEDLPENRWDAWRTLQDHRVDMAIQRAPGRKKAILLADMDSTMIEQECIDELADFAGKGPEVAAITKRAMNGEVGFEGALRERVGLLKGLSSGVIDTVLRERITLAPGGRALIATMQANGGFAVLVSGGFTQFTSEIAARLGFNEHRANVLEISDDRLTGIVKDPVLGREAKVNALEEVAGRLGLSNSDVLAVGDGANDLDMLKRAGAGVALHAKPSVAAQVELRINHGDLSALLFLQGYRRDEFV